MKDKTTQQVDAQELHRDQRLVDLADFLEGLTETGFIVQPQAGYVELWRNGYCYRIEEMPCCVECGHAGPFDDGAFCIAPVIVMGNHGVTEEVPCGHRCEFSAVVPAQVDKPQGEGEVPRKVWMHNTLVSR